MLRRTLLLFSVKFPLKSRGAMLLGTSCNLSQSSNQTSLLELCSDLRRKEFKDYDHLFISAKPKSHSQLVAVELTGFCNYEHSAFVINTDTCTDEDNSTACSDTLLGFLSIRLEDTTILDFIRYAVKYFISTQQIYFWAERGK